MPPGSPGAGSEEPDVSDADNVPAESDNEYEPAGVNNRNQEEEQEEEQPEEEGQPEEEDETEAEAEASAAEEETNVPLYERPVIHPRDTDAQWYLPYGKRCWSIPASAVEFQDTQFDYITVKDGVELGVLLPAKSLPPWDRVGLTPRSMIKLSGTTANGETKKGLYTAIHVENAEPTTNDQSLLRPVHKPVCLKGLEQWKNTLSDQEKKYYHEILVYQPPDEPLNPGEMVGWVKLATKDMPTSALVTKVPKARNFADGRQNNAIASEKDSKRENGGKQAYLPFRQHAEEDEKQEDADVYSATLNGSKKRTRYHQYQKRDDASSDEDAEVRQEEEEDDDCAETNDMRVQEYQHEKETEDNDNQRRQDPEEEEEFVEEEDDDDDAELQQHRKSYRATVVVAPSHQQIPNSNIAQAEQTTTNVTVPASYFAKLVNFYYAHNSQSDAQ